MKTTFFIVLFFLIGLPSYAQNDLKETERVYLPEVQVDITLLNVLDSVLTVESKAIYYRETDFTYGISLLADQYGNRCVKIEPLDKRVPNTGQDWGIMNYKGHSFIFSGSKYSEIVKITENKIPFDFAINQTRVLEDGTLLLDFIEDDRYGLWIFRYEYGELKLVERAEPNFN